MDDWVDDLAATLGVDRLSPDETAKLLAAARNVAHGVERRVTPLATFLAGAAVQRRISSGATHAEAVAEVLKLVESLIPEVDPDNDI